jgi:hypothetical protein
MRLPKRDFFVMNNFSSSDGGSEGYVKIWANRVLAWEHMNTILFLWNEVFETSLFLRQKQIGRLC